MLAEARKTYLLTLCIAIFLDIGFGTLEDDTTLFLLGLWCNGISARLPVIVFV